MLFNACDILNFETPPPWKWEELSKGTFYAASPLRTSSGGVFQNPIPMFKGPFFRLCVFKKFPKVIPGGFVKGQGTLKRLIKGHVKLKKG